MFRFVYTCPTWLDWKTDLVMKFACSPVKEQIIWTAHASSAAICLCPSVCHCRRNVLDPTSKLRTTYTNMSWLCLTRECLFVIGTNCSNEAPWGRNLMKVFTVGRSAGKPTILQDIKTWQQTPHEPLKRPKADLIWAVWSLHIWWSPTVLVTSALTRHPPLCSLSCRVWTHFDNP